MVRSLARARALAAAAATLVFALTVCAAAADAGAFKPRVGQSGKDVIWVPTPDEVVAKMLEMAQLAPGERLVDLGSGDGKIPIAAARRGASAKGIEYNPDMVALSRVKAREAKVEVELVQGDIFESNFSDADVVTLYLLPVLNQRLRPTLLDMKPGTRVVSHQFGMGGWEPDESARVDGRDIHFWRVPVRVEGEWQVRIGPNPGPRIRIQQEFQRIEGQVQWGQRAGPLHDTVVRGPVIAFTAADGAGALHRFEGVADHGGPITGVVMPVKGGAPRLFIATRR